jgi:hypothetical protein
VGWSGNPSKKLSVPKRVSTLAGEAIPGGRGVENFTLGLAGEPVRDWPLLGEDIITKLVVMTMRAKAVIDNLWAFLLNGNALGERRFRDDRK